MPVPILEQLHELIAEQARASGVAVRVSRSIQDGFGGVNVPVLQVATPNPPGALSIRHEFGGDFWLEIGERHIVATWRARGDALATLAICVLTIVRGDYQERDGSVWVRLPTGEPINLGDRL